MKYLLIAPLLIVISFSSLFGFAAQAQAHTETLSGRVVVKDNGKPARGTRIWVFEAKGPGRYTVQQDRNGDFSITLPDGYYYIFIANLGLVPFAKEVWLEHGRPIKLMVHLQPDFSIMQDTPRVSRPDSF